MQQSLDLFEEIVIKKHLQLSFEIDPKITSFYADERKLKQILYNLLSNAVKFTAEGGCINVNAVKNKKLDKDGVLISVEDNGIGIDKTNLKKLFQPFAQLDGSLARHYQGTGLGLAMVKRLVELHGGEVSVVSGLNKGSCFYFWLPLTNKRCAEKS